MDRKRNKLSKRSIIVKARKLNASMLDAYVASKTLKATRIQTQLTTLIRSI